MSGSSDDRGFTLIELLFVIVLIALISTFAAARLDSIMQWKQEGEIRRLATTWQFLFNEAAARGESYRLVLNVDENYYYVRREVHPEGTVSRQVDLLANLRTKREKARRAQEAEEDLPELSKEFEEEDRRQSGALDALYYRTVFADPEGPMRLGVPLEFPALGERRTFTEGLRVRDVVVRGERVESGDAVIRFSPRGTGEFAVVHLQVDETSYTMVNNPATGDVTLHHGYIDFTPVRLTSTERDGIGTR